MKKEKFVIADYEAGGCDVVTRDGRDVRIVCTDANDERPVVAIVDGQAMQYTSEGKINPIINSDNDLFLVPQGPELTDFEKHCTAILKGVAGGYYEEESQDGFLTLAKQLHDLALEEVNVPYWHKFTDDEHADPRMRVEHVYEYGECLVSGRYCIPLEELVELNKK